MNIVKKSLVLLMSSVVLVAGWSADRNEPQSWRPQQHDSMPDVSHNSPLLYCSNFHPQSALDVHQITGIWYGSELLQHHDGENGTSVVNSCVVIHIAEDIQETTTQNTFATKTEHEYYDRARKYQHQNIAPTPPNTQHRFLRLVWDENGHSREVSIRYNQTEPGFWLASTASAGAGSSVIDPSYPLFTGTLQVMKAVDNHLVITFCQTFRQTGELFSILLTRRPNTLTYEETARIRSMLKRRGLNTASVRRLCTNGATMVGSGAVWIALMASTMAALVLRSVR